MLRQERRSGKRAGFTLLETLVVLTIIALLIVILVPTLARARGQAQSAECLSNLRQLQSSAAIYGSQNRGYLPAASEPGEPSWATHLARQMGLRFQGNRAPVDESPIFQCPQRDSMHARRFLGYVVNAMNPQGPDDDGTWMPMSSLRDDAYRRPSGTIYLADAEREDKVVHIAGHPGGATVQDAHRNWSQQLFHLPTIDAMTVWTGSHLPEGKDCVNVTDEPGVRRVARKLHMNRFTNAAYLDGHAAGTPPGGWPIDENNYGVWLLRYGVRDVDAARSVPIQ